MTSFDVVRLSPKSLNHKRKGKGIRQINDVPSGNSAAHSPPSAMQEFGAHPTTSVWTLNLTKFILHCIWTIQSYAI